MRIILDSGGVSALSGETTTARARRRALLDAGVWPPLVPAPVLVESLTGDHRRDHAPNRLLRDCEIVVADEVVARSAAALRSRTGRSDAISAVDAMVVAVAADALGQTRVVTSDFRDIDALIAASGRADILASRV
ncbi:MAG: PIN domain-containing protein [Euzebya sp.]